MKKLAILGLAAAASSFAAGSLWNMTVDAYQVQVPETVNCDKTGADYGQACYQSTGGWWFAYVGDEADGQTMTFDPIDYNPDGTYKLITTDEEDGSIIPGGNLIEGSGLRVTMTAANGANETPAIAGIGFNWTKAETPISIADKAGYCISYTLTGAALQMELGWNETQNGYDSWYTTLAAGTEVLDLQWARFTQDGWDKDHSTTVSTATSGAVSLKIRLKNSGSTQQSSTLTIHDLGWVGECSTAAIKGSVVASNVKVHLTGRSLSFSGINSSANVEVINLQGQVVMNGVLNGALNLANLDAGIYMVRVSGKAVNFNQKIVLK